MSRITVAALTFLALCAPAVAQDGTAVEGPMSDPELVARFNRFGGNMGVTGDRRWCLNPDDCSFRSSFVTPEGRVLFDYLWARTSGPAPQHRDSQRPNRRSRKQRAANSIPKTRNAHRFLLRSPSGQPIEGAQFFLGMPELQKMIPLAYRSDRDGQLGLRLRKPRQQHDLFILAEGYSPVRYTLSGGKLKSANHTIHLEPAPAA
ncbi:MAG: hypothetical protein AAF690_14895, partial [Acidobacteriota bacterium]